MSTYIKIHNEDELYHYGVKGMKWRKHKASRQALFEIAKRGAMDKGVYDSGGYVNKEGNYQWDYVASSNPIKRRVQMTNGSVRLKYLSKDVLNRIKTKESKKLVNRGKALLSKMYKKVTRGYRITAGKTNVGTTKGKKYKRYISVTKNGKPKAFIPY